ncbi:hypothetical protein F4803DRAFT_567856 [Xylaria telfairii]|nr:hypothetical protein F4803DRAFT_567856 [Xylaria telfairii]
MMFPHLLLSLPLAWAALVPQGDNLANDLGSQIGVPRNYSVGDVEWRGFEDFDEDQVFTGTIEDVISQMRYIKGAHYTPAFVSRAENHTLAAECDFGFSVSS